MDLSDYDDGDIVLVSTDPVLLFGRVVRTPVSISVHVDPSLSISAGTD